MDRPESLIERTAAAVSACMEESGDGSRDNSPQTVEMALERFLDHLSEEVLKDWFWWLFGPNTPMMGRFDEEMQWARQQRERAALP